MTSFEYIIDYNLKKKKKVNVKKNIDISVISVTQIFQIYSLL